MRIPIRITPKWPPGRLIRRICQNGHQTPWQLFRLPTVLLISLFLLTIGCKPTETSGTSDLRASRLVTVEVRDEDNQPIMGAEIILFGLRLTGDKRGSTYRWDNTIHGPKQVNPTNKNGKTSINYPIYGVPNDRELTGALIFAVVHPDYASAMVQSFSVNGDAPIQMTRGIPIKVSGYYGSERSPVTELVPFITGTMIRRADWSRSEDGTYALGKLAPGQHLLQLMGKHPTGEIVFSERVEFLAEAGETYTFDLELKKGIRLEGRLDAEVPRPVTGGRALISVWPPEVPAWTNSSEKNEIPEPYREVRAWSTYRPIQADGSFVFESIPPGRMDLIVHGKGFMSLDGPDPNRSPNSPPVGPPGFGIPLSYSLEAPVTKIQVPTEATATLEVTAKSFWGSPVHGAIVAVSPNIFRMHGILGRTVESSETPFRNVTALPDIPFVATTDRFGMAVIPNIPATDRGITIFHPSFQRAGSGADQPNDPLVHVFFTSGQTNRIPVTLKRKWHPF